MSDAFDPYHKWLAIPADEQPPNHYRLLGVHLFEEDADVIDSAADRQMGHVRRFATGQRSELSQKILNEISGAKITLLNPEKRAAYDVTLRKQLAAKQAASRPLPTAQSLPTAQALPKAQAIPTAGHAASPRLRTRAQGPQHATPAGGMDIPIVDQPKSVAQRRRKKKSSPILTMIALLAVAGALIGAVLTALNRPIAEDEEAVAKTNENPPIDNPSQKVILRPNDSRPVPKVNDPRETSSNNSGSSVSAGPPRASGPTSFISGQPVNLLSQLDLDKAVVSGEGWELDGGVLTSGAGDGTRVQIPLSANEYILNVTAERTSGNGQLYLGLPVDGGKVSCIIDVTHERPPGVYAAGFYDGAHNVLTEKTGNSYFEPSGKHTVSCRVQNDVIILYVDGNFVVAWKRDSRELESPEHWVVPQTDSLTLGVSHSTSDNTTYKITHADYRPLERQIASTTTRPGSGSGPRVPGSGGGQTRLVQGPPVNLLTNLDLEKAVVQGRGWTYEDGMLHVGEGTNSRIEMPLPAEEYVLNVVLERLEGPGQFFLGLPVKGGSVGCSIDMVHEQPNGQFAAGFYDGDGNKLMQKVDGQRLLPGRTANISCMVHNERLLLHVNGQFIGLYVRDDRPLALNPAWAGNLDRMLIVGAASSKFKITRLEFRPFTRFEPGTGTVAGTGTGNPGTTGPNTDTIVGAFGERLPTDDGSSGPETSAGSASPSTGGTFDNFGAKKDPPAEEKQTETLAVLQDLFPDEFAAAKTTAGKLALGQKLFDTAQKTQDDLAALYVLLTQAAHYAAEGGNAEVPMRALTELDRKFNVDIITLYVETFDKALKGARAPAEHESLIQQVKQAIVAAQVEDRYEDAEKLMRMAQSSARVTRDADVIKEVAASAKQLRDAQAEFEKVSDAKKTLESDPNDPDANMQWGKYLCVVKNDFPQGMPLLVKGSDAQLKAAAEADLAMPRESKEQIAAGDKWFALADASSGQAETLFRLRAGYWYQRGALGLSGLEKTRIDKRLSDIGKIDRRGIPQPKAPQPSSSRPTGTPPSVTDSTGRISMVGRGTIAGKDMGVTLTYHLGQTIDGRAVREALNKVGVDSDTGIQLNLAGTLLLREPKEIKFRIAGGSSSGGVCYLTIDRRDVVAVGDDRNKDTTITQMLPAGVHMIGLRITGGDLGSCLLECSEAEGDGEVALRTELLMAGIKNLPTTATVDLGQLGN